MIVWLQCQVREGEFGYLVSTNELFQSTVSYVELVVVVLNIRCCLKECCCCKESVSECIRNEMISNVFVNAAHVSCMFFR